MTFAYCTDGSRVHVRNYDKSQHRGKVYCALGNPVIAKRGSKVVWHYARKAKLPGEVYNHMTTWHRWWQDRLIDEVLEIPYRNAQGKIVHIADAVCNGTVIEFQHSNISREDIRSRESTYDNMIWVFHVPLCDATAQADRSVMFQERSKNFSFCTKPVYIDCDIACLYKLRIGTKTAKERVPIDMFDLLYFGSNNMKQEHSTRTGAPSRVF